MSQFNVEGVVAELTERKFGKPGGKQYTKPGVRLTDGRAFELDGFKQRHRVGDNVAYVVEKNYGRFEVKGLGTAPGLPEMPGVTPSRGQVVADKFKENVTAGKVFPVPAKHGDISIIRQNALTNAVKVIGDMWGSSEYSCDGPEAAAEVNQRADVILKLAYRFASFSSGHMDTKLLEEAAKLMPPSPEEG